MTTSAVNYLNIGLMLLATAVAFALPFELFLFSYAVLGPLHYLTEIGWLHKRSYFTNAKNDYFLLILMCLLVFLSNFVLKIYASWSTAFVYVAFLSALGMVVFKSNLYKFLFSLIVVVSVFIIKDSRPWLIFFAVFLPTIIHVFVFTGAFILFGALKSKSISGVASLLVFIICAVSFFIWHPGVGSYEVSEYVEKSFTKSGFDQLNVALMNLFNFGVATKKAIFSSDTGLSVMRFIAFAYTYHYLNWFSKTSIIGWHKTSQKWLIAVAAIWILSVGLYIYDYRTGLIALYFLSMLHVFLEFPLNYRSFIGIGQETLSIFKPTAVAIQKK